MRPCNEVMHTWCMSRAWGGGRYLEIRQERLILRLFFFEFWILTRTVYCEELVETDSTSRLLRSAAQRLPLSEMIKGSPLA